MGAIKEVGSDGEPYMGFFHRNKARFAALIVLGLIGTLIAFIVLGFLNQDSCKKNKNQMVIMIGTAFSLSLFYINVIHKHVSLRFGKLIKYPSFTGYDIIHKMAETNRTNRYRDVMAQYDVTTKNQFV